MNDLLDRFYAALRTGDRDAMLDLMRPDFRVRFADGMPVSAGVTEGRDAAIEKWWAIGSAYRVRPHVEEVLGLDDGRLLALGTYRGTRRADDHEVEARFAHVWTVDDGRLCAIEQITDTARW